MSKLLKIVAFFTFHKIQESKKRASSCAAEHSIDTGCRSAAEVGLESRAVEPAAARNGAAPLPRRGRQRPCQTNESESANSATHLASSGTPVFTSDRFDACVRLLPNTGNIFLQPSANTSGRYDEE